MKQMISARDMFNQREREKKEGKHRTNGKISGQGIGLYGCTHQCGSVCITWIDLDIGFQISLCQIQVSLLCIDLSSLQQCLMKVRLNG